MREGQRNSWPSVQPVMVGVWTCPTEHPGRGLDNLLLAAGFTATGPIMSGRWFSVVRADRHHFHRTADPLDPEPDHDTPGKILAPFRRRAHPAVGEQPRHEEPGQGAEPLKARQMAKARAAFGPSRARTHNA